MAEWSKALVWSTSVRVTPHRGFESHPLRQVRWSVQEDVVFLCVDYVQLVFTPVCFLMYTVTMKRLGSKAANYLFIKRVLPALIGLIIMLQFIAVMYSVFVIEISQDPYPFVGEGFVLFTALFFIAFVIAMTYVWSRLEVHFYRYDVTDLGFVKEHGIINKRYVTIPYEKIQNVDIDRSIFARIAGVSDIMIQTAGYAGFSSRGGAQRVPEGYLPGLPPDVAEELRDTLIRRARERSGPASSV